MSLRGLVEWSLASRLPVLAAAAALLVFGLGSVQQLPVDVLPDLTRPSVTVQAEAPGLATEDVESLVSYPIETALGGLPGLERLRSVTTPGLAVVTAEFGWQSAPLTNRQLVAERLDTVRPQLAGLAETRIGPLTSLMGEILHIALQAGGETTPAALRTLADYTLRPRLLALPGVAQVTVIGGRARQIEVRPDLARLQFNQLGVGALAEALRGYGSNTGIGYATGGGQEIALRSLSPPERLDDIAQLAVAWRGSGPLRLGQVATVSEGEPLRRGDAGLNGAPAVILAIQKQPGIDTLALTRAVEAAVAAVALPADVTQQSVFRQAGFIAESLGTVREALLLGIAMVAAVLLAFLTGWRPALVSLAVIPVSLLGALLVLQAFGESINTMTLGGLAIAIGELVDDAVVAVENSTRRLRENRLLATPLDALTVIARATVEVRGGILYATLLVVLVFVPLLALPGIEGRLFRPLGLAYIAAILASLVAALTLTPILSYYAFASPRAAAVQERRWLTALKGRYAQRMQRLLRRPQPVAIAAGLLLLAACTALVLLPRSFLPPFNERTLTINLLLEPGVSLEASNQVGLAAERLLLGVPEVGSVARRTGRAEGDEHAEGVHYSELDVLLTASGRARPEVLAVIRAALAVLPAKTIVSQPITHRLDHLLTGVRAPLVVKIAGDDLAALSATAQQVETRLRGIEGLADVQAEAQTLVPQLSVQVEARRAAEYGTTPARVQQQLAQLAVGERVATLVEGEQRVPLVLRLSQETLATETLGELRIDTPAGTVPLAWLGTFKSAAGPNQVLRENRQRRLAVFAFADGERSFPAAVKDAEAALGALKLPAGITLHVEGVQAAQRAASTRIAGLALLSLLLIAAALYSQYRSLALMLIVLGSLPLALAGGVLALAITATPLSVASLIGFITLAGIAARNSILKLSHYRYLLRVEQLPFDSALIVRGAVERLTPVLLTAGIAALALLPLLVDATAPGKEILHPVALVIFGGLITGTVFDSFATPLLFQRFGHREKSVST